MLNNRANPPQQKHQPRRHRLTATNTSTQSNHHHQTNQSPHHSHRLNRSQQLKSRLQQANPQYYQHSTHLPQTTRPPKLRNPYSTNPTRRQATHSQQDALRLQLKFQLPPQLPTRHRAANTPQHLSPNTNRRHCNSVAYRQ